MLKFLVSIIAVLGMLLTLFVSEGESAGLVMSLKLDDGAGKVAKDATGNGNDGTINGDAQWVDGKSGGALKLTGPKGKGFLEPGLNAKWWNKNINNASVFMWVKSNDMKQPIFFGSQDPQNVRLYLAVKDGFWNMGIQDKSWGGGHKGTLAKADTEWHAIALTMDKGTATLYVDGEKTITKPYTKALVTNKTPLIGALNKVNDGASYFLNGIIDEVRMWDEALTQADIKANMKILTTTTAVFPEGHLTMTWGKIKK